MNAGGAAVPYPGLRPFSPDEADVFFGREVQIDELLRRLRTRRFLAVVGTSGSGKSSLVRAGMLPALYGGFMAGTGARWRIAMLRPGGAPLANLAAALEEAGLLTTLGVDERLRVGLAHAVLARGALGLVELVRERALAPGENVLVLVDQFEELFRFAGDTSIQQADEADAFVRILLEAVRASDLPIFVVLTMRSDFLGNCARFRELPEAINDGLFLVPRLTRDELRAAIDAPARVSGSELTPRLANRLLNDIGDDPDALPVLQHALMRTWYAWVERGGEGPIDLTDYEGAGAMATGLSQHGDELVERLGSPERAALAQRIFRALTELGPDNRGIRHPLRFDRLCAVVEAPPDSVSDVLAPFRAPDASFVMPPANVPLDAHTVVDITHESLMRTWPSLRSWVEAEARAGQMYRRSSLAAELHERGEAALWRDPDLALALAWREAERPNAAWAERYGGNFERTMRFLDQSAAASEQELASRRVRTRATVAALAAIALVLLALLVLARSQYAIANAQLGASQAKQVATAALALPEERADVALVLAVAASDRDVNAETTAALFGLVQRAPRLRRMFHGLRLPAFSGDGRYLAMVSGFDFNDNAPTRTYVWDLRRGAVADVFTDKGEPNGDPFGYSGPPLVAAECFVPSTPLLVQATSNGLALVLNLDNHRISHAFPAFDILGKRNGIERAACLPHSTRVALLTQRGAVSVIDAASRHVVVRSPLEIGDGSAVGVTGDGATVVAGGEDGRFAIVDPLHGVRRRCRASDNGSVSIVLPGKGPTVWVGSGGTAGLEHVGLDCRRLETARLGFNAYSIAPAAGGGIFAIPVDQSVVQVLPNGRGVFRLSPPLGHGIHAVALDSHDAWLTADGDAGVDLYAAGPRYRPLRFDAHTPAGYVGIAVTPDDVLWLATGDGAVERWRISDGARLDVLALHRPLERFAARPDRSFAAAVGTDGSIVALRASPNSLNVAWSAKMASAGVDDLTIDADAAHIVVLRGDRRSSYAAVDGSQTEAALPPADPTGLAKGFTATVSRRLSRTGRFIVRTTQLPGDTLVELFGPDGRMIASHRYEETVDAAGFSDDDARLFLRVGHTMEAVTTTALQATGPRLSLGDDDTIANALITTGGASGWLGLSTYGEGGNAGVQLYDRGTFLKVGTPLMGADESPWQMQFSHDGRWLAAVSTKRGAFLWETGLDAWKERACDAANRLLSADEWASYGVPWAQPVPPPCGAYGVPVPAVSASP